MNKIYKVVWSKARQCYVVASELARRSGKKSAAVLAVAACTMSIWGGQTALAASMPSTYTKDGVTYKYNHESGLMGIYYNTDKKGYALVTYSDDTYATVKSSVTGTYTSDKNVASGRVSSVLGGQYNTASGDYHHVPVPTSRYNPAYAGTTVY